MSKLKKLGNKALLSYFMEATREQVFSVFAGLPRAERQDGFVFIPGTDHEARRLLLVAHADTVWDSRKYSKITPIWDGHICTSTGANGLGADDRAGCAMLWLLRGSGASLLLTDEEESGCIGARKAVDAIGDRLGKHAFAVQMDRRGDQQAVFYDAATEAFQAWLLEQLAGGWRRQTGSFSDVAEICPQAGINGVNLSAGFLFEHRSNEMLFLDAWYRSVMATRKLVTLVQEMKTLPDWGKPKEKRRWVGKSFWGDEGVDDLPYHRGPYGASRSEKRGNGHAVSCRCDNCKELYFDYSTITRKANTAVHSSSCMCLDCKRRRETGKGNGKPADNGKVIALPAARSLQEAVEEPAAGAWKPCRERGWRQKQVGRAVVYDQWDGNPATLQDMPEWEARELREKASAGKARVEALDGGESSTDSPDDTDPREPRTSIECLLEISYDELAEDEQSAAYRMAVSIAHGLVHAQRLRPEAQDFDAAEAFYEMIVLPAYAGGVIDAYDAACWEARCILNHDQSDPRIEGFLDGCIAAMYAVKETADA